MISLQTIAIAEGATDLSEPQQVKLFRFTLRHSVVLLLFTGVIAMLYSVRLRFLHGHQEASGSSQHSSLRSCKCCQPGPKHSKQQLRGHTCYPQNIQIKLRYPLTWFFL